MKTIEFLQIGKIVGTHGIRGEVKVEHWCDSIDDFLNIDNIYLNNGDKKLDVEYERVHKSHVLIKFKNISSRDEAECYRGECLYAKKCDIPINEGSYFIAELKGCKVIDGQTNVIYGTLNDVLNHGSVDIYSIIDDNKKEYLLPIVEGTILDINLDDERILVKPIKGIFNEY